jgi:rare lipoprotein A
MTDFMIQKRWSGLTAALMVSTLSLVPVSRAEQPHAASMVVNTNPHLDGTEEDPPGDPLNSPSPSLSLVVKVGASQSSRQLNPTLDTSETSPLIAQVLPHRYHQRQAATLYVHDIPVLTFLAAHPSAESEDTNLSSSFDQRSLEAAFLAQQALTPGVKTALSTTEDSTATRKLASPDDESHVDDPVWRATSVAALINYLYRDGLDAESIQAYWNESQLAYVIWIGDQDLVQLDDLTILSDTTSDPEQDTLQAANRLRRLLGNAAPLRQIESFPQENASDQPWAEGGSVEEIINGWASWYGPGFEGAMSASGEMFSQGDLTAAHPWLPFGTRVRVTNLDNGRSVVVRINDRGPYAVDRVLDVSEAAAQFLGMIQTGVAPVRLDVLSGGG